MSPILGTLASQFSGKSFSSYESIATVAVGSGGQASIQFTSIPSTYKDLQIRLYGKSTWDNYYENIALQVNGSSTATDYKYSHYLQGDGSVVAGAFTGVPYAFAGQITGSLSGKTSMFGMATIDILDYANTNKYKTIRGISGFDVVTSNQCSAIYVSSAYYSTTAISSLLLLPGSGSNFAQYTSAALYGIKG